MLSDTFKKTKLTNFKVRVRVIRLLNYTIEVKIQIQWFTQFVILSITLIDTDIAIQ